MKITLNTVELAGVKSRMSEWEKKNSMEPSVEFVMTMLSGLISEDLSQYLDKVFDIKKRILAETDIKEGGKS